MNLFKNPKAATNSRAGQVNVGATPRREQSLAHNSRAFDFSAIATDEINRIELVRGLYLCAIRLGRSNKPDPDR